MDRQQAARNALDAMKFHGVLSDEYGHDSPEACSVAGAAKKAIAAADEAGVTAEDYQALRKN